jgi:hypothetical protein
MCNRKGHKGDALIVAGFSFFAVIDALSITSIEDPIFSTKNASADLISAISLLEVGIVIAAQVQPSQTSKSYCAGLLTPHSGKIKDRVAERGGSILRFPLEFTALPSRPLFRLQSTPLRGAFCLHPVRADHVDGLDSVDCGYRTAQRGV